MEDPMIGMNMPLDMTLEIDGKCDDYRVSLVLDPKLKTLLKKDKPNDFKEFIFEGKKFEYDQDEEPLSEDDADYDDGYDYDEGMDEEGMESDDDWYRRRLQFEEEFVMKEENNGFYISQIINGPVGWEKSKAAALGYAGDSYEKVGS